MPGKKKPNGKSSKAAVSPTGKKPAIKAVRAKNVSSKKNFYIITIGASAGGLNAINELITQLNGNLNAAIFIVIHLSKAAVGEVLLERIKKSSKLRCQIGQDGDKIMPGHIYVAAPDTHLLIKDDKIVVGHGPPENRFRPSIDVLFRSAAACCGERAIGIILTGMLNDGTVGMQAIKQSGGYCIVQDPNEAEYPSMPLSVLENLEADQCVPLKKMGNIIESVTRKQIMSKGGAPQQVIAESRLSELVATSVEQVSKLGRQSYLSCPDCGGGLWLVQNGRTKHYRCHIGHSYSEMDLEIRQSQSIEKTLWVAVRMMEERKLMVQRLVRENYDKGLQKLSDHFKMQAGQLEEHINRLKELIFGINKD